MKKRKTRTKRYEVVRAIDEDVGVRYVIDGPGLDPGQWAYIGRAAALRMASVFNDVWDAAVGDVVEVVKPIPHELGTWEVLETVKKKGSAFLSWIGWYHGSELRLVRRKEPR